jgi:hypothetical protein
MQEELARSGRLMSVVAGSIVGGNMAVVKPQLAIFRLGVGIAQIYLACPDGFDLRALERNACLDSLLDMIVVVGFAIYGYYARIFGHAVILASGYVLGNLCGIPGRILSPDLGFGWPGSSFPGVT